MKTYYTTSGSVRGSCGHKHRTISGAVRCLLSDHAGCKSQGGYSDRGIRAYEDGEQRDLTVAEHDEWQWSAERSTR